MKKTYLTLFTFMLISSTFAQIKYDDGPIITGTNFVSVGTWGRNNITFSFQNGTNDIAGNDERNAVREAFQIWSDYGNINFTEVTSNADLVILWGTGNHGDGNAFDGVGGVLAHAFFPPPNGGAFAGDIHFDDDETWTLAPQATGNNPRDLVTVAAHEIGHAIGLGHSNVACALMNPFYTGSHRYLSQDDIDGVQSIYGNRTAIRSSNISCSGGTLFINNLPVGATVFWASSDVSVATVANVVNQGIVSRTGSASGSIRITATITLPCGTTVTEFIDLVIGTLAASDIIGMDGTHLSAGQYITIYIDEDATAFNWSFAGGTIIGSSTDRMLTAKLDNCFNGQRASNEFTATVSYQNACGTSLPKYETSYADCDGNEVPDFRVSVAPNPAKGSLYVEIKESKQSIRKEETNVDYHLYTMTSNRLVKYWTFKGLELHRTLSISDVKPGRYLLVVTKGKEKQSRQVIIE